MPPPPPHPPSPVLPDPQGRFDEDACLAGGGVTPGAVSSQGGSGSAAGGRGEGGGGRDGGDGRGPILRAVNVFKTYKLGRARVPVLRGVSIDIHEGEWVAILGASGSGKSTLLHLLGGLDRPDRRILDSQETGAEGEGGTGGTVGVKPGEVEYLGRPMSRLPGLAAMDRYRADTVGFVFQFYHLLPELNVVENVLLPAMVRHRRFGFARRSAELRKSAGELLEGFGLGHRLGHRPAELSGGERQRVAVARSLINRPKVVLADEPTGNLDPKTGHAILDRLEARRQADGFAVVMVTHDPGVAERASRVLRLVEGRLVDE